MLGGGGGGEGGEEIGDDDEEKEGKDEEEGKVEQKEENKTVHSEMVKRRFFRRDITREKERLNLKLDNFFKKPNFLKKYWS